ncbi:hypothetical protein P152DRAFT_252246 [Eremomyces bilateralis CBS 781.70]|uniref:Uncharacterized protein n=1 Tax=Eremomyces bilateralis CBS 781.70 TaxID=1392243 RepID=A0A6G1FQY4_9PEZI|nr:uncharacterized protein P152DRAFT_252246 [Eremomyces bilateralis CBS 781.70]KAF1808204.1 hypothetical protein P152DRAFT_252246 [Eremomyces bilateralis CBS 781.70]
MLVKCVGSVRYRACAYRCIVGSVEDGGWWMICRTARALGSNGMQSNQRRTDEFTLYGRSETADLFPCVWMAFTAGKLKHSRKCTRDSAERSRAVPYAEFCACVCHDRSTTTSHTLTAKLYKYCLVLVEEQLARMYFRSYCRMCGLLCTRLFLCGSRLYVFEIVNFIIAQWVIEHIDTVLLKRFDRQAL